MASPSLPPYEYEEIVELNYEFVNRDGIRYHLYFTPMDVLYPDMVNTYSFNIERRFSRTDTLGVLFCWLCGRFPSAAFHFFFFYWLVEWVQRYEVFLDSASFRVKPVES